MGLDIRWPIGLMFTLIGAILAVQGVLVRSDAEMLKRSLNMNVNLGWGIVLLIFGVLMIVSARIAAKAQEKAKSPTTVGNAETA
jgi:protein-S-isoprenylcysteine O-methyltransferase Ste14